MDLAEEKPTKKCQIAICRREIKKGNYVTENLDFFFNGEMDVAAINKSGYISEFEVKVSRSDFRADAKKYKWNFYGVSTDAHRGRCPNYFWYVCPEGMIKEAELLKPYMGLIYIDESGNVSVIRKAKMIHKVKHNLEPILLKIIRTGNWRQYFGGAQLTVMNREIKKRNDERIKQRQSNK